MALTQPPQDPKIPGPSPTAPMPGADKKPDRGHPVADPKFGPRGHSPSNPKQDRRAAHRPAPKEAPPPAAPPPLLAGTISTPANTPELKWDHPGAHPDKEAGPPEAVRNLNPRTGRVDQPQEAPAATPPKTPGPTL